MIHKLEILAVLAYCFSVSTTADIPTTAATEFLLIQKTVYELMWHVDQADKVHPELYKRGISWDIEANLTLYTDKGAVTKFLELWKDGMLQRGRIFSIFYETHLEEAAALFGVLFAAGDIQTLLDTAAWARVHVNEYLFTYVFTAVLLTRSDTRKIRPLLPSETNPHEYFNMDVMRQLYEKKMSSDPHVSSMWYEPGSSTETLIIYANHSDCYTSSTSDPETKLAYFREDVDLNNYYYFLNQEFPFWIISEKYNVSIKYRGELWLYLHKLYWKRYELERSSHGLHCVESFNLNRPIITGYTPTIGYRNGSPFPQRKSFSRVPERMYRSVQRAEELESRITAAIDFGHFLTADGISDSIDHQKGLDSLGDAIAGNSDSPNFGFYGSIDHTFRRIFGSSPKPSGKYKVLPGALEHFSTSMRDPGFYRICKRIAKYFDLYKKRMPPYTQAELSFKGVEIESIVMDKLVTFFDWSDYLISNSERVRNHQDAQSRLAKARQYRLNHKPFSYYIAIKSDKRTKAVVRIFLGPKYNCHGKELDFRKNCKNFYQFEYFIVDLIPGTNKIERKSTEATFMGPDYQSSDMHYKQILDALVSGSVLPIEDPAYNFPERLLLPRGRPEGYPVQFFFHVSKFVEEKSVGMNSRNLGEWNYDTQLFGFPLDRPNCNCNFTKSNMFIKTVPVYHESEV